MEGKILNLQILQRPSSINSPEQTLRMPSPAAASDPTRTLDEIISTSDPPHIPDIYIKFSVFQNICVVHITID
jgi:hypothetical protein